MTEPLTRAMRRLAAGATLFAEKPSRLELSRLDVPSDPTHRARVQVFRNHAIEPILAFAKPFADHARIELEFVLSDYDDTLSFATREAADVYLVYADLARYEALGDSSAVGDFLTARTRALRASTSSPILLVLLGEQTPIDATREQVRGIADAHVFGVHELVAKGEKLVDPRTAAVTGTRVSTGLHATVARALFSSLIPAAWLPPIKAVAVDLDETLYRGILGEDGPDGVELTDAHRALQDSLVALRDRGVFLALVSRNERPDVEALFARRTDFALRLEHFSATEISWDEKSSSIASVASRLRIGVDAIVFVDDNPGELAAVLSAHPTIHAIHAHRDAAITERAIALYPGVRRLASSATDALRIADLRASEERERVAVDASDDRAYFESLGITLRRRYDDPSDLPRLADLCRKTNQFNLALRRFGESDLEAHMADPAAFVVAVELEDRISKSGTIGVVVGRRDGSTLVVEELCVSCRAMGRRLDDAIVIPALLGTSALEGCDRIAFDVAHAPRNRPALDWISRHLGMDALPAPGTHELARGDLVSVTLPEGITFIEG